MFFLLLLAIRVETWKYTANARITVDNRFIFDGKSSQISLDETRRENLVGFIFYEFNCNYLNRTRRICFQLDFILFLEVVRFALYVGEACTNVPRDGRDTSWGHKTCTIYAIRCMKILRLLLLGHLYLHNDVVDGFQLRTNRILRNVFDHGRRSFMPQPNTSCDVSC